jgi:protein-S-isoprenylcysteine O-methyltransferase Ste14
MPISRAVLISAGIPSSADPELSHPSMHVLELKIPPVVLVLATALLMWLASRALPHFGFELPARSFIAVGLAIVGAMVCVAGVLSFVRARTTVDPMKPSSASSLVVSGVYRFTRNPMYLGFLLALLGWGVFLSNALSLLGIPGFVLYMNRFQIRPEERALAILFERDFSAYSGQVRRWV